MKFKKKYFFIPLFILIDLVILAFVLFQVSKSRTFQFFGESIHRVETNEKVVALTFDDGPTEYTDDVLNIVNNKNVKATFYVIGSEVEKNPEITKQIVNDGHELGNHSYTHQRMLLKSPTFIREEVEKTTTLIRKAGYKGEITFRPPYGKRLIGLPWYLSRNNIKTTFFDVEADTYLPKGLNEQQKTDFLVDYTLKHTKPGSIVLLHPFCKDCGGDRDAIGRIIDELKKQDYKFVTITELLKYQNKSQDKITYIPIGDSYTIGNGVAEESRWPNVLVSHLQQEGIEVNLVENPAVSGFTVRNAIDIELPVVEKVKPDFVTVLIGANDNFGQRDVKAFQNELNELLDKTQAVLPDPKKIVLITLPDYSKSPAASGYDTAGVSELIEQYNEVIKSEAKERDLKVADIFPVSQTMTGKEDYIDDGLHPSAAGYTKWEKVIFPVVRDLLK